MKIDLSHIKKDLFLEILGEVDTLSIISEEEAMQYGEAKIQIKEGCNYEYQFSESEFQFKENSNKNIILTPSRFGKHKGTINPNIYVGMHNLEIENCSILLPIEVCSVKSKYREDYRYMLESITEKCTDLIMQIDAPIIQHFETNFDTDSQTLYQRFSFVKSLIDSKEFEEAIQKITSNPTTKWEEEKEEKDIRAVRRFNQKSIKQLVSKTNRMKIGDDHFLNNKYGLGSVPIKIDSVRKIESIDTNENRFIKLALEEFLFFCENCETKFEKFSAAKLEAKHLSTKISNILNQSFFKEISRPNSLKLNSPVLQRKSGYREVLNAWLKFDLAAKLVWKGGDNVYDAGKKDIATLYEYWLFFTLLDLLKEVFRIEPKSIEQLIQFDNGRLSLNLKQGTAIALKGIYKSSSRNLNIQFSYNRSFGGGKTFPNAGSYTTTLRPDYTLSIWPEGKDSNEAEKTEQITHIHFDAKYKVNNFYELISKSKKEELTIEENNELIKDEEEEIKKGTFKNQDLLKMHAYKDAIRRTSGAYVLYPGEGQDLPFRGFHELIPGLGAFVIKPNKNEKDKEHLKNFILQVVKNFNDRASQREHTSVKIYDIHKHEKPDSYILEEPIPEYLDGKKLIPDETFVLIGYYKKENWDWIIKSGLYNARADSKRGSLRLGPNEAGAKYLLLHTEGELVTSKILKITETGPRVFSKQTLIDKGYPNEPSQEYYLVYRVAEIYDKELLNVSWDISKLEGFKNGRGSALPFSASLTELMKEKVK